MFAYHLTSCMLAPNSIIMPGNWGRMLNLYSATNESANNYRMLLRELIYEEVRIKAAPTAPSRLHCVFCCPSYEAAVQFKNFSQRWADIIYEVELPGEEAFYGNWIFADVENNDMSPAISSYEHRAELYWKTDWKKETSSADSLEILSSKPVKILRSV